MTKISETTNSSKTKIVFFGNERLVSGLPVTRAPILNGLVERGYDIAAVVSHHTEASSRNGRELEVAKIAERHNIPVYLPNKPSEIMDTLKEINADIAVLAAYGRIINQAVIDLFPLGIVNVHPSLLPKYRGPTPIESAILNGDAETGVSIMQLTAGMDEGGVYAQQSIELSGDETKFELYEKLSDLGTELFFKSLPNIISGTLQPKPQDDSDATYSKRIEKSDGVIDWHKPAAKLEREIRAYEGWPKSRTSLGKLELIITRAHAVPTNTGEPGLVEIVDDLVLMVDTADGRLCIDALKPQGKKEMPIAAFLAGYKSQIITG